MTAKQSRAFAKAALIVGLIVGALFAALPVLWMISSSFKSNTAIFAYPPRLIDETFSFAAYQAVLLDPMKRRFFFNSYLVSTVVTILTAIVAILAGFAFSRYNFRLKGFLSLAIIGVQSIPPITLMIPYFGLIVALGIYNSYWALILTYMVFTLPYAIIMMTGYMNTLPKDLDEAVLIDGGSNAVILWRILVPISLPGIVSVGVYTFMLAWNEFLFALTLTRTNEMRTVPSGSSC